MSNPIKYSLPEIERRWLVPPEKVPEVDGASARRIEDRYLVGTRLRLRRITEPDGTVGYKLCKKYGKTSSVGEPITNLYLTEAEYACLAGVPAYVVVKTRFRCGYGSLDVYEGSLTGTAVFEREFASEREAHE